MLLLVSYVLAKLKNISIDYYSGLGMDLETLQKVQRLLEDIQNWQTYLRLLAQRSKR